MKAKTVIILVICGALLLTVVVFGIFFARGGEVIYPSYHSVRSGCDPVSADKGVVEEIAKLHFTFNPSEELKVEFQGIGVSPKNVSSSDTGEISINSYQADVQLITEGWTGRSFPSKHNFVNISEEEFRDALFEEIQSRISSDAKFELECRGLFGDAPYQLKQRPKKQ